MPDALTMSVRASRVSWLRTDRNSVEQQNSQVLSMVPLRHHKRYVVARNECKNEKCSRQFPLCPSVVWFRIREITYEKRYLLIAHFCPVHCRYKREGGNQLLDPACVCVLVVSCLD